MPDTIVANRIALPERTAQAFGVDINDSELLKRLVQAGIDSGRGLDTEAVFARLEARCADPTEV